MENEYVFIEKIEGKTYILRLFRVQLAVRRKDADDFCYKLVPFDTPCPRYLRLIAAYKRQKIKRSVIIEIQFGNDIRNVLKFPDTSFGIDGGVFSGKSLLVFLLCKLPLPFLLRFNFLGRCICEYRITVESLRAVLFAGGRFRFGLRFGMRLGLRPTSRGCNKDTNNGEYADNAFQIFHLFFLPFVNY